MRRRSHRITLRRLALAALWRRKLRVGLAALALVIGAALVTALLTLYSGVRRDLGGQLRRFGANAVLTPAPPAQRLPREAAARAEAAAGAGALAAGAVIRVIHVAVAAPAAVGAAVVVANRAADAGERPIVGLGADFSVLARLNPTWRLRAARRALAQGQSEPGAGVWLGARAATALEWRPGDALRARVGKNEQIWTVAGTVASGAAADNQIFPPLAAMQSLTGERGLTTVELRIAGPPAAMAARLRAVRRAVPAATVAPVRPIAVGEGEIWLGASALLLAATGLILATLALCLIAALTSAALERSREFGLMRALGANAYDVLRQFLAEALVLGAAAAVAGFFIGAGLAAGVARAVFGATLWPTWSALAAALAAGLSLACIAALAPWPVLRRASPAKLLREE